MRKFFVLLIVAVIACNSVFAGVSSSAFEGLGESVTKPIEKWLNFFKGICICALVGYILYSGLKYLKADSNSKPEIAKNLVIGATVGAIIILAAFKVPAFFGLGNDVSESAVILLEEVL